MKKAREMLMSKTNESGTGDPPGGGPWDLTAFLPVKNGWKSVVWRDFNICPTLHGHLYL